MKSFGEFGVQIGKLKAEKKCMEDQQKECANIIDEMKKEFAELNEKFKEFAGLKAELKEMKELMKNSSSLPKPKPENGKSKCNCIVACDLLTK